MPQGIRITVGGVTLAAELNDTATAEIVYRALPFDGRAHRWGDELYVLTDLAAASGDPVRSELEVGELAFWPGGGAFCIFWGPTPASRGDEPRAVSDVVPIGRIRGSTEVLDGVPDGSPIRIESGP